MAKPPSKADGDSCTKLSSIEKGYVRSESFRDIKMPVLPKSLTLEEKKFLLAVERGDLTTVKRIIHRVKRGVHANTVDLDCMDPLGRGALLMAIDNENLQMVELLVVMGIATRDALLHAIDKEFVEAVELLLEHEELIHKDGEPYSWENVDRTTSSFTPDITPLVLAAHRNNYEILKILLDRGATIPVPHDVQCGCDDCIRGVLEDSLRHSMSRINAYRALSSPSLIALSSTDPILTAFELSIELKRLAYMETEFRQEYMDLRGQCQLFACDLLSHTRSSSELAFLLNHDPSNSDASCGASNDFQQMKLSRLELAIDYKQKKFVAHPNIQQLLGAIWYEGLPGFRRKSLAEKMIEIALIALLFPIYCVLYMIAPTSAYAQLMRKPFMKFLIHASSYLFFLFLLILVSQRFDVLVVQLFGTESMRRGLEDQLRRQRGNGPTFLETFVAIYVIGYVFEEIREMWKEGLGRYIRNMWNVIDVCRDTSYLIVMALRVVAYIQQQQEISVDPRAAYIPREEWDAFDPQLIAEGVCAMANIFSALKLVHLFSINPYLGPLQISLGRMVLDIVKFFFIYSLVLFSFACGLNQLLWYFSDLERQKCFTLPDGLPDWTKNPEACTKWRRFANLFESSQSLFWASFGLMDLGNFELTGVKSYTRFWGMLIFGAYSVINVVVLLNLLIAMMSNSYSLITEHSDTEWKFARSKLWMSYFDSTGNTLPPPFNLLPTPKKIMRMFCFFSKGSESKLRRNSTKGRRARERDFRYAAVLRSLVWRYVTTMHRRQELSQVTEDDVNEVKGDISTLRFELLDVFKNNGMDISSASKNTKAALGRKMRIWERRLLRDFHVVSVTGGEDDQDIDDNDSTIDKKRITEGGADKFRRFANVAVAMNSAGITNQTMNANGTSTRSIKTLSQIGKSMSNESFKSSQNLRKAMEEAQRLTVMTPTPEPSSPNHNQYSSSPLPLLPDSGASVLELLRTMSHEEAEHQNHEIQHLKDIEEETLEESSSSGEKPNQFGKTSPSSTSSKLPWKLADKKESSLSSLTVQSDHPDHSTTQKETHLSAPNGESNVLLSNVKDVSQLRPNRLAKKAPLPPTPSVSENSTSQKTDQKKLERVPSKILTSGNEPSKEVNIEIVPKSIELVKPTVVNTPTEKVENPKPLESKIKSDQKDAGLAASSTKQLPISPAPNPISNPSTSNDVSIKMPEKSSNSTSAHPALINRPAVPPPVQNNQASFSASDKPKEEPIVQEPSATGDIKNTDSAKGNIQRQNSAGWF